MYYRAIIITDTNNLFIAVHVAFYSIKNLEKEDSAVLRDLLILLLLKSGVSYEAIGEVIHSNPKTIANRFPLSKIVRKRENA